LKLLTEDERQRLLTELEASRREIQNTLEKMPLNLSTKARVDYKLEMEAKLKNLEDALLKFHTKKEIYIDITGGGRSQNEDLMEDDSMISQQKRREMEEAKILKLKYMK
jgi:Calmodulin-binding